MSDKNFAVIEECLFVIERPNRFRFATVLVTRTTFRLEDWLHVLPADNPRLLVVDLIPAGVVGRATMALPPTDDFEANVADSHLAGSDITPGTGSESEDEGESWLGAIGSDFRNIATCFVSTVT